MFCKNCGSEVNPEHRFCMSCGAKLEPVMPVNMEQPQQTASANQAAAVNQVANQAASTNQAASANQNASANQAAAANQNAAVNQAAPVNKAVSAYQNAQAAEPVPASPAASAGTDSTGVKADESKKKSEKKSKKPIIIAGIIAIVAVIAAAAGVLIWHNMSSNDEENDDPVIEEDETETEELVFGTEDTESDTAAEDEIHNLLVEQLNSLMDSMVYIAGTTQDISSGNGYPWMLNNGYMGALIKDISGDGVEDLVVVYSEDSGIYADIYTVEDSDIVTEQEKLQLLSIDDWDYNKAAVYLKNTKTGYNLVAESYTVVSHYADGVEVNINAYSCAKHKYISITDYSAAGSDIEQDTINSAIANATKAGLVNITTAFDNMFLAQDSDVELIAGLTAQIDGEFDYDAFINLDNYVYEQAEIANLTESGIIQPDAQAAFLEKISGSSEDAFTGDYVFPMSDQVLLTEEDVAPILDDQEKLSIARNEIYARHGRMFDTEWLQEYFNSKPWYEGIYNAADFDQNVTLSDIETQNAAYLLDLYNERYGN
mgnify:CR=1 FL=1